jgi:hypothetical protein
VPRLLGEPHERGFVPEIGLHRRVLQRILNMRSTRGVQSCRSAARSPLTSGDDINIVALLKVHLEELFSDTFRNGPIVILFVEPIPKLATERGVNSA